MRHVGILHYAATALACAVALAPAAFAQTKQPRPPLDAYPAEIAQSLLTQRQAERAAAAQTPLPSAFALVASNLRWAKGDELIVAFHGGSYPVWRDIAAIANQWSKVANIRFNFALDPKQKTARTWNPAEPDAVAAHVRIRLDVDDVSTRWSAVGREAFKKIFAQGTMTLGGIVLSHPLWSGEDRADILHEFGHVLGFLHEQHRSECAAEFRMEPGPKGEPSILDLYWQHHQWPHQKTRANLLLSANYTPATLGPPDRGSLFLYPTYDHLLPGMLNGAKGPCYAKEKNLGMSKLDRERARKDYPFDSDPVIDSLASSNVATLKNLASSSGSPAQAAPLLSRLDNLERALRPQVRIRLASPQQSAQGDALRRTLEAGGYFAASAESPAPKAAALGAPIAPEVRFFAAGDAEQARAVADLLQVETGSPVPTRLLANRLPSYSKPPVEVWLQR